MRGPPGESYSGGHSTKHKDKGKEGERSEKSKSSNKDHHSKPKPSSAHSKSTHSSKHSSKPPSDKKSKSAPKDRKGDDPEAEDPFYGEPQEETWPGHVSHAATWPLRPTVTRLPGRLIEPSTLPSMKSDSDPVTSPFTTSDLPMVARSPVTAGATTGSVRTGVDRLELADNIKSNFRKFVLKEMKETREKMLDGSFLSKERGQTTDLVGQCGTDMLRGVF